MERAAGEASEATRAGGARRHAGGPAVSRRAARLDDARGGALHGPRRARRVVTTRAATEGPLVAALVAWASQASVLPDGPRAAARALVSPRRSPPSRAGACSPRARSRPHRAFVKIGSRVVPRFARIPKIRRILQRKWPIWGKHLLRNKMRAEVTSYRLAINEAWRCWRGRSRATRCAPCALRRAR